jgi:hypothetical protein
LAGSLVRHDLFHEAHELCSTSRFGLELNYHLDRHHAPPSGLDRAKQAESNPYQEAQVTISFQFNSDRHWIEEKARNGAVVLRHEIQQ